MPRSSDPSSSRRSPSRHTVQTPLGPSRAWFSSAAASNATLVLGHGAGGGGIRARDLVAVATHLPERGINVVRVEQPWLVAGRTTAAPPPQLDRAWVATLERLRDQGRLPGLLVVGGRSAGARVACRTAVATGAAGVVALAFPLHPPGRPHQSRLAELLDVGVPTLVVQGSRDPFGTPEEFPAHVTLRVVPGGDHSFKVPRSSGAGQEEALELLVGAVVDFTTELLGVARPSRESRAARKG
jgi:predicted alpha/beta-hydrolase family hydrolase